MSAACLDRVFLLYPDPWPKRRQRKRRLVSDAFLSTLARVVKPGGATYLYTTNRWKFSLRGFNGEYRVPFFNWTSSSFGRLIAIVFPPALAWPDT